jgi:hypothetical protein
MKLLLAIKNALGFRRYLIIGVVTAVAFFYQLIRSAVSGYVALPDLAGWQLFATVVPVFVLWHVVKRAAELEDRLVPRMSVKLVRVDHGREAKYREIYGQNTQVTSPIIYWHVVVTSQNDAQIERCGVRLREARSDSETAPFSSPIILVTADRHVDSATLYPNVPQHFGVVASLQTVQGDTRGSLLVVAPGATVPRWLGDFFQRPATYWLTVAASGDNTPTVVVTIKVAWNGDWQDATAELVR